jgi:hypothetical protein
MAKIPVLDVTMLCPPLTGKDCTLSDLRHRNAGLRDIQTPSPVALELRDELLAVEGRWLWMVVSRDNQNRGGYAALIRVPPRIIARPQQC